MTMFSDSLRAFLKPVVPFLDDPDVSEIMINGPREVWVEKRGKLHRTEAAFTEDGLLAAARNMAQYVGRPLTEERPRLDARLPDGSRIHVVLPPVARRGTTIAIRKFFAEKLTIERLVQFGSMTRRMARFLDACVRLKENIVVSGGTGSGKTSLLNVLSSMIPADERILTIEDSAELQLQQPHLVSFESRPADRLGKGEVDIGDLLHSALRLRPDRIVVGEVRGGECFHLLQAMNTGHGGTLTTAHANTPVDTLRRLESLCLLSGIELPLRAVRAQVASAVHLVVCCERFSDGTRKVTCISEALPLDEHGEYRVRDLFVYEQTGRTADGRIEGHYRGCGEAPTFVKRLQANGYPDIDEAYFAKAPIVETDPEIKAPAEVKAQRKDAASDERTLPPGPPPAAEKPAQRSDTVRDVKPAMRPRVAQAPQRTPPPPAAPIQPVRAAAPTEESIQLDPELMREVEARLPHESTLITRNPLLQDRERTGDETQPGTRKRP